MALEASQRNSSGIDALVKFVDDVMERGDGDTNQGS